MPNNRGMNASEIIRALDGVTAVARMLKIKPPSVQGWLKSGIPDGRLIELAARIEVKSNGRFTRRSQWPDDYEFIWPELAQAPDNKAQAAIKTVAAGVAGEHPMNHGPALAGGLAVCQSTTQGN
jgi:hypothetical protein